MFKTRISLISLLILVWAVSASAIDVTLEWDPNTESDLAGYRIYYGVNGLSNPNLVTVDKHAVTTTITGLDSALNYSFAFAAYNTSGLEAPLSNVVVVHESILPTITAFSLPVTSTSQTTPVSVFTATDNANVTGYLITENLIVPDVNAVGWSPSAPTSYAFSKSGAVTAYAWVKDTANNISAPVSAAVTITLPYTLNLTFSGYGSGSIHGGMTCVKGGSCPPQSFANGTVVTLIPTASAGSYFAGWIGACTNTEGNCVVPMIAVRNVTAKFNVNPVAWIPPSTTITNYYGLLTDAYSVSYNGKVIKARTHTFVENLVLDRNIAITIIGGYDASYTSNSNSFTTIDGKLTVQNGCLRVANLVIR